MYAENGPHHIPIEEKVKTKMCTQMKGSNNKIKKNEEETDIDEDVGGSANEMASAG